MNNDIQKTLATLGFDKYAKTTRPAAFLGEMQHEVPWSELCTLVEPGAVRASRWAPAGPRAHGRQRHWRTCCTEGETRAWSDSADIGKIQVIRHVAPKAHGFTQAKVSRNKALSIVGRAKNRNESKVRGRGEHPFLVIKRRFGSAKVCNRGIAKNANGMFVGCALGNLFMVRRTLLRAQHSYA